MTDTLVPVEGHVTDWTTGELMSLGTLSIDGLAALREKLTELDYARKQAIAAVDSEVLHRVDQAQRDGTLAAQSFDTPGGYHVEVTKGRGRTDYFALRRDMIAMAQAGELDQALQSVEDAFVPTGLKADTHRWRTLVRRNPQLDDLKEQYTVRDRDSIRVTRLRTHAIDATVEEDTAA